MSQQINLFNPVLLQQEKMFSAKTMAQVLAGVLVVLLGLALYSNYRFQDQRAQAEQVASDMAAAQALLGETVAKRQPDLSDEAILEQIRIAQASVEAHRTVLNFINAGELGNLQGYSQYFQAFARHASDKLWLTGFAIEGNGASIRIDGRSLSAEAVPRYIASLKQETLFRGKSFDTLELRQSAAFKQDDSSSVPQLEFTLRSVESFATREEAPSRTAAPVIQERATPQAPLP